MTRNSGVTVVGIPARDEERTVRGVAEAADAGLRLAFPHGDNAVVLADNGSTDGTVARFAETPLRARKVVARSGREGTGKGTNVFAVFDRARELGADRVLLLDADVRSAEPGWVGALAEAVDGDEPVMALPCYRRDRYEANTTNHLVSPLLAAVHGAHVQQPIGGEFAFNRAFLERAATWERPDSAQLYGIDVWLTANALREGLRLVEVPLGRKLHNSPFPKILRLPQQVLDSLFHVVLATDRVRGAAPRGSGLRQAVDVAAVPQDPAVVARVADAVGRYLAAHRGDVLALFPAARGLVSAPWGLRVGAQVWPELLADAVVALSEGWFTSARDHLVALYVNRVMTFWDEIEGLDGAAVDAVLDRQAAETARAVAGRGVELGGRVTGPGAFHVGHWSGFTADEPARGLAV
ncbi:glycosyltransferase family 2 protein [Actinosynnema pretiosum]|uniref:Glucosyl-3-phosphoglycerate synthase n=1 Tax=Actinosynnema pretiosum TaxID=42197 RepID=A0A290ZAT8_9PSEU|nr:glycosyltransferase [Actinosynnema pretiosum]ATE56093.1 family 2 glycosyl transferase [Actinosynnema pretiosum]